MFVMPVLRSRLDRGEHVTKGSYERSNDRRDEIAKKKFFRPAVRRTGLHASCRSATRARSGVRLKFEAASSRAPAESQLQRAGGWPSHNRIATTCIPVRKASAPAAIFLHARFWA